MGTSGEFEAPGAPGAAASESEETPSERNFSETRPPGFEPGTSRSGGDAGERSGMPGSVPESGGNDKSPPSPN
jgi:hypothetical protein